jgi:hypothetical protein
LRFDVLVDSGVFLQIDVANYGDGSTTLSPFWEPTILLGAPAEPRHKNVAIRRPEALPIAGSSGSKVCRMHGAAGGAPRGNRNAIKHGEFAAKALALKREIQALARIARETMATIE